MYIIILLLITIVQVGFTVLFIVKREKVIEWATEHIKDEKSQEAWERAKKELERNLDITRYVITGISILTILILLFAMFYRCSVSSKKREYREQFMHQDRYE